MTTYIFYASVLCEAKILKVVRCHQVAVKWLEAISGFRRSKSLWTRLEGDHTGPFDISDTPWPSTCILHHFSLWRGVGNGGSLL